MIGESLGPYKILEPLGAGGMGEVYLGEDTRLGRKVAIKVLPAEFAGDPERLARFEQEARAAAALNHPNIAVVHDVGCEKAAGGEPTHFIVQEFLDGDTLRAPLNQGAMPLKRALALALEIAEALAAAHAAGIVHRDLKPENIFVTKDGHAKVLDFGLAKLTEIAPAMGGSASMSPTMLGTVAGQVMGTAGYMAPEQVNGEPIDGRADVFAFGCVLYEMSAGKRAFSGKNLPETLHRLVNTEPDPIAAVIPALPLQLHWIVGKALAKDPAERYQSADELVVDVRRLSADVIAGRGVSAAAPPGAAAASTLGSDSLRSSGPTLGLLARWAPWVVAAAATAVAVFFYTSISDEDGAQPPLFLPLEQLRIETWSGAEPIAISPDGFRVVFAGDNQLELLDLRRGIDPQPIRGTERGAYPAFSPDGEWIAFAADNEIRAVRPGGALPRTLVAGVSPEVFGLSWSADDRILYTPDWGTTLYAVPGDGGEPVEVASPDAERDEQIYAWASLLPGGDHLLYSMWDSHWNIVIRTLDSGESRILIEDGHDARYVGSGHLVFVQDDQLLAATFDLETFELGEPRVVIDDVVANFGPGWGAYAFSATGTLAYLEGASGTGRQLWRVDADGTRSLLTERRERFNWVELSPDGRFVASALRDPRLGSNLALFDIEREGMVPLTSGFNWVIGPTFSPDGTRLLYATENPDHIGFRIRSLDGSGNDVTASGTGISTWSFGWRADGLIGYSTTSSTPGDSSRDIWILAPGGEPEPLITGPDNADRPAFSPVGDLLAYVSDRTGRPEVYVRRFPAAGVDEEWQVSSAGGNTPRWSGDGKTVWFINQGDVFAAPLLEGAELRTAESAVVFSGIDAYWDIATDGSYLVTLDRREPPRLRMILNWFDDLRARVPRQ